MAEVTAGVLTRDECELILAAMEAGDSLRDHSSECLPLDRISFVFADAEARARVPRSEMRTAAVSRVQRRVPDLSQLRCAAASLGPAGVAKMQCEPNPRRRRRMV
jgi:hypothetical protein